MPNVDTSARIRPSAVIGEHCEVNRKSYIGEWSKLDGSVKIGENVIIGDRVTVTGGVIVGNGSIIGNGAHLHGDIEIGKNCFIHAAEIGGSAEMYATEQDPRTHTGKIKIGNNVIIREYVTIHASSQKATMIGNNVFLMVHSHVGHDAEIGNNVTVSPTACIGGFAKVHDGAYVGMQATIHQHSTIGAYAMVGMGSVVVKDIPPFVMVGGTPAKFLGINRRGMERNAFLAAEIAHVTAHPEGQESFGDLFRLKDIYKNFYDACYPTRKKLNCGGCKT